MILYRVTNSRRGLYEDRIQDLPTSVSLVVLGIVCRVITLSLELVDLIFHAGHLCILSIVIIVVLLLDLDEGRWLLAVCVVCGIVALSLELVDLIFHASHLCILRIVIIVVPFL